MNKRFQYLLRVKGDWVNFYLSPVVCMESIMTKHKIFHIFIFNSSAHEATH